MCGNWGKGLCPLSLGLALGVTSALTVLIWSMWVMYNVPPNTMMHIPTLTWGDILTHTGLSLVKGFLFGFFLALFYDLFISFTAKRKGACGCQCGCGTVTNKSSTEIK